MHRTVGTLVLGLGVLAGVLWTPGAAAAATPDPALRLAAVEPAGDVGARLTVAVPSTLARQALPVSAFHVRQAGHPLPVTVRRLTDAGMDVFLVLDTTVRRDTFAAEQSSAADLLRSLPTGVRIATTTTDLGALHVPEAVSGSLSALRTLAAVRPQATTFLPERLNAIAALPVGPRRRVIVLLTDCLKPDMGDLSPLRTALATGKLQLDVVAPGAGCPSELSLLAGSAGGLAVTGDVLGRLDQALDAVLLDLLGQYQLSVAGSPDRRLMTVTVDYAGVHSTTGVPSRVPPSSLTAGPVHQPVRPSSPLLATLAMVAAIALAASPVIAGRAYFSRGAGHRAA
ncbi:MAG: hypothetical protein DLM59_20830 [Pseudonocardiales bacterium]|nr:MAG: hypothetical protein DLM59_20830 [Pseudonocardiales bacterium]